MKKTSFLSLFLLFFAFGALNPQQGLIHSSLFTSEPKTNFTEKKMKRGKLGSARKNEIQNKIKIKEQTLKRTGRICVNPLSHNSKFKKNAVQFHKRRASKNYYFHFVGKEKKKET